MKIHHGTGEPSLEIACLRREYHVKWKDENYCEDCGTRITDWPIGLRSYGNIPIRFEPSILKLVEIWIRWRTHYPRVDWKAFREVHEEGAHLSERLKMVEKILRKVYDEREPILP